LHTKISNSEKQEVDSILSNFDIKKMDNNDEFGNNLPSNDLALPTLIAHIESLSHKLSPQAVSYAVNKLIGKKIDSVYNVENLYAPTSVLNRAEELTLDEKQLKVDRILLKAKGVVATKDLLPYTIADIPKELSKIETLQATALKQDGKKIYIDEEQTSDLVSNIALNDHRIKSLWVHKPEISPANLENE
jgi:hypothetical protein